MSLESGARKVRKKKAKLVITNLDTALNPNNYDKIESEQLSTGELAGEPADYGIS